MRIKNPKKRSAKPAAIIMSILLFGGVFLLNQNSQAQSESKQEQETKTVKKEVDEYPEYPGGNEAVFNYIQENTKYPKTAKENKISGTVYIELTISMKGDIQSVKMLRGIKDGEELNQEAIRVVKSIPKKWTPAMKDGKAVASNVQIPIKFNLPKEENNKDN